MCVCVILKLGGGRGMCFSPHKAWKPKYRFLPIYWHFRTSLISVVLVSNQTKFLFTLSLCIYMYMYACLFLFLSPSLSVSLSLSASLSLCIDLHVCTCVHVSVSLFVSSYIENGHLSNYPHYRGFTVTPVLKDALFLSLSPPHTHTCRPLGTASIIC